MATRKLVVEVVGDASSLERAFSRASRSGQGFGSSIRGLGRDIVVGLAATGAAALAAGAAVTKLGSDFQDQMQQIVGLSGVAQKQVDAFGKQVLQLAPTVGKSPQELAKSLYFITSSGIAASKAMDVLTNSAKASVAGLGDTEVVADAVTSAINAYGAANISAKQATDVLVATVREGKGEAASFAGVIGNVAALSAQLGVSFNDVGAALAAQTRLGIDAETSATQLQRVFSTLVKVTPQSAKAFKSVGLSAAGLRQELKDKGLLATLQSIKAAFGDNLPALSKAFGDVRAVRGVLALIGKSADETTAIFERMKDTSGSLATAFDAVSSDTAQQFRKMRAAAEVAGISIGAAFAPLAGKIAGGLAAAANAVTTLVTRVTAARSFSAKLNIIWTGIDEAARSATSALEAAFAKVDWNAVFAKANGIADGLQRRLEAIDWSKVGATIGTGIATGIAGAAAATKEIAARFEAAFKTINWVDLGRAAGPGLAAAVVTAFATLTDPSFWIKNWDLALAVAVVAFPEGKLAGIGAKLSRPLADLVAKVGADLVLKLLRPFETLGDALVKSAERAGRPLIAAFGRIVERLGGLLLDAGAKGAELLGRGFSRAAGLVGGVFDRIARKLGKPLTFLVKVLGLQAAIDAVTSAFSEIAQVVGHALDAAFGSIKTKAIKAVLELIAPFTKLPSILGVDLGGPFKKLQTNLETKLAAMQVPAQAAGKKVGDAVIAGLNAGLQGPVGIPRIPEIPTGVSGPTATPARQVGFQRVTTTAAAVTQPRTTTPTTPTTATPPARKGITAEQRNQVFDSAISSDLSRAGFIESVKGQIAALQRIAGLISERLAATKDVTRRRTLEDQLLSVQATIRGDQKQLATDFIGSLQFGFTRAQATAGFGDDLKALEKIQAALKAEIKATGSTLDLQQQVFDNQRQIIAARNAQRNAAQFKALGLTATGDTPTPGVKHLKAELGKITEAVSGTFLDTDKTKTLLASLKKVLAGGLGAVGQTVRAKVQEILDGIDKQLKDHANGPLTKTTALNASRVLAGIGLGPDAERTLRARLSHLTSAGTSLVGTGSGSRPRPSQAFGARQLNVTVQSPDIYVDGTKLTSTVSGRQRKTAARNPGQRRGPNAGLVIT